MSCMESSNLLVVMALSMAGMLLVPVLGLLLRFQPQFVHGLHVNARSAEVNCYIVGGLYAGVFLVCSLLSALTTRDKTSEEAQNDADRRNKRYGLPFVELESNEFVKAMDAMDRRTTVTTTTPNPLTLELPTKFSRKGDAI